MSDQRGHLNRKLRFQGFCRFIRLIERVFWSFYSTVRSDLQYWLAFSWPYNLLSDKVLCITIYSCANAPAGPGRTALQERTPDNGTCAIIVCLLLGGHAVSVACPWPCAARRASRERRSHPVLVAPLSRHLFQQHLRLL